MMSLSAPKIKTAVIPAAGLATRFLPVTKSVMKGLIPILETPMIQYIVEEAVAAGIEEIVFVTSPGQTGLSDYFSRSPDLESTLRSRGKPELADKVKRVGTLCEARTVVQKDPRGLGHAVLCAEAAVKGPFAVLLPDEIMVGEPSALSQLVKAFEQDEKHRSCVGVVNVPRSDVHRYGVVSGEARPDGTLLVEKVIEKPSPETAPSTWVLPGRYVFTPGIFEALKSAEPKAGSRFLEWQLTDGIEGLARSEGVLAVPLSGERFDTGNPLGYFEATLAFALARPEWSGEMRSLMKKYGGKL